MRTIPTGFLDGSVTNLQPCWVIVKRDGAIVRGTECDENVTITTGVYAGTYLARAAITGSDVHSTDDMAVDNLEVKGALVDASGLFGTDVTGGSGNLIVPDVSTADLKAGLFDNAEAATFLVNVTNTDLYQFTLRSGWIGNVTWNDEGALDGGGEYTAEMRGLTQALSQNILRTYSISCDAELGDSRCKVDMTPFTFTRTVVDVDNRREFGIGASLPDVVRIRGGTVTFTSGLNAGYRMEIKDYLALHVTLYRPMPADITVGDTVVMRQGCDKALSTCIDAYSNVNNYRGHAFYVPGDHEILKVGTR